jgi:hypothetical protein
MLLKVFRDNQGFTILFLLLLSAILWSLVVFNKSYEPGIFTLYNTGGFFLFPSLHSIHQNVSLSVMLNILLVLFSGYYFSRVLTRYLLIPGRNLITMLVFFFLSLPWFTRYSGFSYALLTLPVLLFVTDLLFKSAEKKTLSFTYFNGALIISIASFVNYFLAFYFLFIFFLYFRLRGGHWREFVFIFFGAIIPYLMLFALLYLTDGNVKAYMNSYGVLTKFRTTIELTIWFISYLGFLSFLFILGSWKAMNQYVKMKILTRKYAVVLLTLFGFSLVLVWLVKSIGNQGFLFIATPLSFLFGYYFTTCRTNIVNQALFFIFMLSNAAIFASSLL